MVSDEQLLEDLREFADEIGETPTQRQMRKSGPWSKTTYQKAFGSWNEALKEAGLHINQVKTFPDSKEQLLEDLREFADEIGETPTRRQTESDGPWDSSTYQRNFGSWNRALKEAELDPVQEYPDSKEKLLEDLQEFAEEISQTPTRGQMNEDGPWTGPTYSSYFGSWNEALKQAGLDPVQEYPDSKEQLLEDLQEFADEIGETPTTEQMTADGPWTKPTYIKYFGSWNKALKEAGLDPVREYSDSKEQLLKDLREFADEIGETPSKRQMEIDGPWGPSTYRTHFGSWNEALKQAGLEPIKEYPIESEWDNGVDNYYGESWPAARRKALKRDEYTCQVCGETDSPHVHHITPRRCFEEPDDSNTLDNLITLCASCHGKCEGRWTELESDEFAQRASKLIKKT